MTTREIITISTPSAESSRNHEYGRIEEIIVYEDRSKSIDWFMKHNAKAYMVLLD